jgi:hypothetical protein
VLMRARKPAVSGFFLHSASVTWEAWKLASCMPMVLAALSANAVQ